MKIVFTSDMHGKFNEVTVPTCDILIDSGDYSFNGTNHEISKFYGWLNEQPATHIISVQGNHEWGWEERPRESEAIAKFKCPRVHLLHDSEITIDGIKIYGAPWQPWFHDWAWNLSRGKPLADKWKLIPEDTQILVTHGPPYQILDDVADMYSGKITSAGCGDLRARVDQLKELKYHTFGHLHYQGGQKIKVGNTLFLNSALNNDSYQLTREPHVIEYGEEAE